MPLLQNGQEFPRLEVPAVGGGTLCLPDDLAGSYSVILIYRGSWCPYCRAQLGSFARATNSVAELGIRVVALSVDDEATSAALVDRLKLTFPVGYGADADKVSDLTGAYVDAAGRFLQSTGFVLAPDGTVVTAVYSSAAIGRLVPDDVIGLVRYETSHA